MPAVSGDLEARYQALLPVGSDLVQRTRSRQGLVGDAVHRLAATLGLAGDAVSRFGARQGVSGVCLHRYSDRRVVGDLAHRCGGSQAVGGDLLQRVSTPTADYLAAAQTGRTATGEAPEFSISLQAWRPSGAVSIDRAYDLSITLRESAAATWELAVRDEDGAYNPDNSSSATWSQRMTGQPFGPGGQVARKLLVAAEYAGVPFQFTGLPTAYGYTQNWRDRTVAFTWRGVDASHRLFREDQTMPDLRSTAREIITVTGAIGTVLAECGIPYDLSALAERAVPFQSRQKAKPIDWVTQLLEVGLEEWRMRGETFIAYYPAPLPKEQAHWTLDFTTALVADYSVESSPTAAVSKVTARRVIEAGGYLAEGELTPSDGYGQFSLSWGQPGYGVGLDIEQQSGGVLSDFIFFDAGGNPKAVMFPRAPYPTNIATGSPNGAVSCKYTWGVPPGNPAISGGYAKFRLRGTLGRRADSLFGSTFDETFVHEEENTDYLDDPEACPKELPDNPLIPTPEWLQIHCQRYLQKHGRQTRVHRVKLHHLHTLLEPGQTVRILHPAMHLDRAVYVTEVQHRFSDLPDSRYTEFSALEYL